MLWFFFACLLLLYAMSCSNWTWFKMHSNRFSNNQKVIRPNFQISKVYYQQFHNCNENALQSAIIYQYYERSPFSIMFTQEIVLALKHLTSNVEWCVEWCRQRYLIKERCLEFEISQSIPSRKQNTTLPLNCCG